MISDPGFAAFSHSRCQRSREDRNLLNFSCRLVRYEA